jgi:hypothetical protein
MLGRESEKRKNKQQIFMAAIVKIVRRHIKHAKKISFNFSLVHSNGHKHCLRQRLRFCQSGRGGLLIFMMIIDSIENLLSAPLLPFYMPIRGHKIFHEINQHNFFS